MDQNSNEKERILQLAAELLREPIRRKRKAASTMPGISMALHNLPFLCFTFRFPCVNLKKRKNMMILKGKKICQFHYLSAGY